MGGGGYNSSITPQNSEDNSKNMQDNCSFVQNIEISNNYKNHSKINKNYVDNNSFNSNLDNTKRYKIKNIFTPAKLLILWLLIFCASLAYSININQTQNFNSVKALGEFVIINIKVCYNSQVIWDDRLDVKYHPPFSHTLPFEDWLTDYGVLQIQFKETTYDKSNPTITWLASDMQEIDPLEYAITFTATKVNTGYSGVCYVNYNGTQIGNYTLWEDVETPSQSVSHTFPFANWQTTYGKQLEIVYKGVPYNQSNSTINWSLSEMQLNDNTYTISFDATVIKVNITYSISSVPNASNMGVFMRVEKGGVIEQEMCITNIGSLGSINYEVGDTIKLYFTKPYMWTIAISGVDVTKQTDNIFTFVVPSTSKSVNITLNGSEFVNNFIVI